MKKILKDKDTKLDDLEIEIVLQGNPWDKQQGEPEESFAALTDLINNVPDKTVRGLFNYLEETKRNRFTWPELKRIAEKFKWVERAWAYDRSLGERITKKNEAALEKVQTEMEKFAITLIEKNHELTKATNPEKVMMNHAGLIMSAKNSLPTQVATVYKALVGDKLKMEVDGKFDHRVAVAVAQFAKDTL